MSYFPARTWNCNYCPGTTVQEGPRGADVLPVPPPGWYMVDLVRLIPAHSVKVASGERVKVADARDTVRRVVCPACSPGVLDRVLVG